MPKPARRLRTREERWRTGRAGPRAGRGFHYQDEVSTHLAIECWQHRLPFGRIIPEGLEDVSLEHPTDARVHGQVKSRLEFRGPFPIGDIRDGIHSIAEAVLADPGSIGVLILERDLQGLSATGWDRTVAAVPDLARSVRDLLPPSLTGTAVDELLGSLRIIVGGTMAAQDQATIADALGIPFGAAVVPYLALRSRLVDCADANAAATPDTARSMSLTEIEAALRDAVALVDVLGLNEALAGGALEPVDLNAAPGDADRFYEGIDVRPGHVTAGLVIERDSLLDEIDDALDTQSPTLIVGPSGAGKSALVWSAVIRQRTKRVWYRLKRLSTGDVPAVVRFVRATAHGERAGIGLAVDDLGMDGYDGWDLLIEELSYGAPPAVLVAAIREEDLALIGSAPRHRLVRPRLDEPLAATLYERLKAQGRTHWPAWREPFEASRGLLLEYAHLLTAGQRLTDTIADQLQRRRREGRSLELDLLRLIGTASSFGVGVAGEAIRRLTGAPDAELQIGMQRLIREHLVAETSPLRFGGTHILRSRAIAEMVHEPPPPDMAETIASLLAVLPPPDLTTLVAHVLSERPAVEETVLAAIVMRMESEPDAMVLHAALDALSAVSSRRTAEAWLEVLRASDVPSSRWQLLLMSAVIRELFPGLSDRDRSVVSVLDAVPRLDLRTALLSRLPDELTLGFLRSATSHQEALAFVWSLPVGRIRLEALLDSAAHLLSDGPADKRAALLAAAVQVGSDQPEMRRRVHRVSAAVLEDIVETRPFTGVVRVDDTEDGRVVVGEHIAIAPTSQGAAEQELIALCHTLGDAVPDATAVHARVIDATGQLASDLLEKRIPRTNLPAPTVVDWNRGLLDAFARITAGETWTPRITIEAELLVGLTHLMPAYLRDWLRGARLTGAQREELRRLSVLARSLPPSPLDEPADVRQDAIDAQGVAGTESGTLRDWVEQLLVGLVRLLERLRSGERPAPIGAYIHDTLLPGLRRLETSSRWRYAPTSPSDEISRLTRLLQDLYAVLCAKQLPGVAGAQLGRDLQVAARTSALRASQVLDAAVRRAETALADSSYPARVVARPRNPTRANDWPSVEVVAFIEVPTMFGWIGPPPPILDALRPLANLQRDVTTIPTRRGQAVGSYAGRLIMTWHVDRDAADAWGTENAFLVDALSGPYRDAIDALLETSAIVALARSGQLKPAEEAALESSVQRFDRARLRLVAGIPDDPPSLVVEAVDALEQLRVRVAEDATAADAGTLSGSVASEIGRAFRGDASSDLANMVIGFWLGLIEFDVDPAEAEERALAGIEALGDQGN